MKSEHYKMIDSLTHSEIKKGIYYGRHTRHRLNSLDALLEHVARMVISEALTQTPNQIYQVVF